MLEILPESQGNTLGVKASGKVTDQDYKEILIPAADKLLAEHGRGRFLYYLSKEFKGFELAAILDDVKYVGKHSDKFDKIALVGGPRWINQTVNIAKHFIKAEMKEFTDEQIAEAWVWVRS